MSSLSFDGMVEGYDETRVFDRDCFDAALNFLVDRFPPQAFGKVFEPGIGTGRIAVPLAERGYCVTGVDISAEMLALLNKRLRRPKRSWRMRIQQADVTHLPFPDAAFDMAIAVHLFYFIQEWQKAADEILRVVDAAGPVVLMHTGTGLEIPSLNGRYKELCAEQGCVIREIGVKSTREVVDYVQDTGCQVEWVRDRWQWTTPIQLDKALGHLRARAYSFTTIAPDDAHQQAIEQLESELTHRFGKLAVEIEIPNQIYLVIIRRQ